MPHTFSPSPRHLALITGGAGFIGSHLVGLLLQSGWRVRVLDNLSSGRRDNLPETGPDFDFLTGDIRDEVLVQQACAGAKAVFHLAALVSVIESTKSPGLAEAINLDGTRNVYDAALAAGVRRLVFSSSCAVYGDKPADPQHEELPAAPTSPYAATKLAGEKLAAHYTARGLGIINLRYFNVYGPRQSPHSDYAAAVPRFVSMALTGKRPVIYGDGRQTRDFVYVADVVRANLRAAELSLTPASPTTFNIGTGQATSVLTLWQHIAAVSGQQVNPDHAPARAGEVRDSRADVTRARQILGFETEFSLAQGLAATTAALRSTVSRL